MASKEYTRTLNGNAIPESYRKQSVAYTGGGTVKEIIAMGHAENEAAVVRVFYNGFNIAANPLVTKMANEGKSLAEIGAAIAAQKMAAEVSKGGGGSPEGLAKAHAVQAERKAKASKIDALRAQAASDPKLAAQLAELGLV